MKNYPIRPPDPGGHSRDDEHEEGKELAVGRKDGSALGVGDVLGGEGSLDNHLRGRREIFVIGIITSTTTITITTATTTTTTTIATTNKATARKTLSSTITITTTATATTTTTATATDAITTATIAAGVATTAAGVATTTAGVTTAAGVAATTTAGVAATTTAGVTTTTAGVTTTATKQNNHNKVTTILTTTHLVGAPVPDGVDDHPGEDPGPRNVGGLGVAEEVSKVLPGLVARVAVGVEGLKLVGRHRLGVLVEDLGDAAHHREG